MLCPHCGACVKEFVTHCSALTFAEVRADPAKVGMTRVWKAEHEGCGNIIYLCVAIVAGSGNLGIAEVRIETSVPDEPDDLIEPARRRDDEPSMN